MLLHETPFETPLAAVRWAITVRELGQFGGRTRGGGSEPRPCEPADVFAVIRMLVFRNQLRPIDLEVLEAAAFGLPHPGANPERWDHIDRLLRFHLERKMIVRPQVTDAA